MSEVDIACTGILPEIAGILPENKSSSIFSHGQMFFDSYQFLIIISATNMQYAKG
jgi:hypothetical protein